MLFAPPKLTIYAIAQTGAFNPQGGNSIKLKASGIRHQASGMKPLVSAKKTARLLFKNKIEIHGLTPDA